MVSLTFKFLKKKKLSGMVNVIRLTYNIFGCASRVSRKFALASFFSFLQHLIIWSFFKPQTWFDKNLVSAHLIVEEYFHIVRNSRFEFRKMLYFFFFHKAQKNIVAFFLELFFRSISQLLHFTVSFYLSPNYLKSRNVFWNKTRRC